MTSCIRITLSDPAEILASVPALLGFTPIDSVILLCLGGTNGTDITSVVRHDLPPSGSRADVRTVVDRCSAVITDPETEAVIIVGFGVDVHAALVGALADRCDDAEVKVAAILWARSCAVGEPWQALDADHHGVLADPRSGSVAAAQVYHGRPIYEAREEIEQLLRPDAARSLSAVRVGLTAPSPTRSDAGELRYVLRTITSPPPVLPVSMRVRLAHALSRRAVRDALFAVADGPYSHNALNLWLRLARALPAPHRAQPAVLAAHCAYARGNGPLAGIALTVALEADPAHGMATILSRCLAAGMRPSRLGSIVSVSERCAADLGVALPGAQ